MKRLLPILALGACLATPAWATTIIARTNAELAVLSDAVVLARVQGSTVERADDGSPLTRHSLAVESWWQGSGPAQIDLLQFGGRVDGKTFHIPGDLELEAGQRIVVFLKRVPEGWASTLFSWSVYEVHGDKVKRQGQALATVRRGPGGVLVPTDREQLLGATTLDELQRAVTEVSR